MRTARPEALKLAAKLAQSDSAESLPPDQWRRSVLDATSAVERTRAARAVVLAALEEEMASSWSNSPTAIHSYINLLAAAGHPLGPAEQRKQQIAADAQLPDDDDPERELEDEESQA